MAKLNPIILLGAGGLALLMMGGKKGGGGSITPEIEVDPDLPDVDEPPPEPATNQVPRKKVPSKTGVGSYNVSMFPNLGTVRGVLGGLSPRYIVGATGNAQQFLNSVKVFQQDWNAIGAKGMMGSSTLNKSRLITDGVPGPQTLRAMEWARSMSWPSKVVNAGL